MYNHLWNPTNNQIADDWNLWREYIDPSATMTEAEFNALSIGQREAILNDCFPGEDSAELFEEA
jgi:hypothetical protein